MGAPVSATSSRGRLSGCPATRWSARLSRPGTTLDGSAPVTARHRLAEEHLRDLRCQTGTENLCLASEYTGWDADSGFAEYAVVRETWACSLPAGADPVATAPLLCSGIIGYRALRRARPAAGARARCSLRRPGVRSPTGAAGRGDPLRPGRRPGAGRARGAGPGWDPGGRRHPPKATSRCSTTRSTSFANAQ